MIRKLLFLLCVLGTVNLATAQQRTITGVVSDESDPLIGVSILIKGTSSGTITDIDGSYSLDVPDGNTVLVYSYTGYETQEITVGAQEVIDVLMSAGLELEEVVVTALGFKVRTDKTGSAVSSVKAKDIVNSGEASVTNAIQGKMAGVNITRSTGDPGSGSNIRIRGANTISGSTQPLIIIDGIPVSNGNSQGRGSSSTGNGVSQQSRLNDINPNDIQTLQVLKGASAAALWGSRASNGVIVITTKSGQKGFKVNLRSSVAFDEVTQTQNLQDKYGQGRFGNYRAGSEIRSWGDEIAARAGGEDDFDMSGGYFIGDQTGTRYYPVANGTDDNPHGGKNSKETFIDENFDRVFRTGVMQQYGLDISAGDDKNAIFFSLGTTNHKGVILNNDYDRYTVNLTASRKFSDFVELSIRGKYARIDANRIQQNSNTAGLLLGLYRNPADFNIVDYTGTYVNASGSETGGRHRSYRNGIGSGTNPRYNNPLWTTLKQEAPNVVNRYIYSAELDFYPVSGLNIKFRGGMDGFDDQRSYLYPIGSTPTSTPPVFRGAGGLLIDDLTRNEINFDAIAKYDVDLNENITSSYILGWNINDRKFTRNSVYGNEFIADQNIYNLSNSKEIGSDNFISHSRSNRGFATLNFGLFDQLYIDISGALEAASTINDPFFYPAASAAWQFSESGFFPQESVLSFGKVRLSWGKVGIQPAIYRSSTAYENFSYSSGIAGSLTSDANGGGFRLNDDLGNSDLKPEIKTELEAGLELRWFKNVLSTSFTYYTNEVEDILLTLSTAPSSGFSSFYANGASLENRGFEFEFNANLLRNKSTDWIVIPYGNFATNKNEVTSLASADIQRLTGFGTGDGVAAVGHQMGAIYGGKLPRNEDGTITLDENGFPEGTPEYDIIGDPNPDWTAGLGLNLGYKNIALNVLFEHSQGGDFYDMTRQINSRYGKTEITANKVVVPAGGLKNVRGDEFTEGETVRGNIHDFGGGPVLLDERWYDGKGANNRGYSELWLQDATWTRLREVTLSYSLGQNVMDALPLSGVTFSITGRNLFLISDVDGNDPDKNFAGVGNSRGLDYYTNPATRSFLFNLNLTF